MLYDTATGGSHETTEYTEKRWDGSMLRIKTKSKKRNRKSACIRGHREGEMFSVTSVVNF